MMARGSSVAVVRSAATKRRTVALRARKAVVVDKTLSDRHRIGPRQIASRSTCVRARRHSRSVRDSGGVRSRGVAESMDTAAVVTGSGGSRTLGRTPVRRTAMLVAFKYELAASWRRPASLRFSAGTTRGARGRGLLLCEVAQDVAHALKDLAFSPTSTSQTCYPWWPVFRCSSVAGFRCPPRHPKPRSSNAAR